MHAYFDCFSGISGDMTLGAFMDLGVPEDWLKKSLSRVLPENEFDLAVSSVSRKGIQAARAMVTVSDTGRARDYAAIKSLITDSPLETRVKETSLAIFKKIAEAEAKIHDCPVEKVHFHEIGAIDSIVDIVGTALCLDYLGIQSISSSKIPLGQGFVACEHGTLPVPVPATVEILKNKPVYGTGIPHELVTPTGAGIIAALADSFGPTPDMIVQKVGYGAGKRDLDEVPNLLRIITGELNKEQPDQASDRALEKMVLVETCIDDMNPEIFGFLMDRLFEDGALDVYLVPVYMKKNRPGTMVQVLCRRNRQEKVVHRILSETSTTGIRFHEVQRQTLSREEIQVDTSFGRLQVKQIIQPDGSIRVTPEYEVCRQIALDKNIPIKDVYHTIITEAAAKKSGAGSA